MVHKSNKLRTSSRTRLKGGLRTVKKTQRLIDHFFLGVESKMAVFVTESDVAKPFKNGTFSIRDKNEYLFFTLGLS